MIIDASDGNDTLFGSNRAETLRGEVGNDAIDGGGGNDTMDGGAGNDTLNGGDGDDTSRARPATTRSTPGPATTRSGCNRAPAHDLAGRDRHRHADGGGECHAGGFNALTSSIEIVRAQSSGGSYTPQWNDGGEHVRFPRRRGSGRADGQRRRRQRHAVRNGQCRDLQGRRRERHRQWPRGNDTLEGGVGNDTLNGEAGDDTLDGGSGNDALNGGDGNDTIESLSGDDTIDAGTGDDTIRLQFNGGATTTRAEPAPIRSLVLSTAVLGAFNATTASIEIIRASSFGVGYTIDGTSAANTLDLRGALVLDALSVSAGDGNDTLFGTASAETLRGESGNDTINAGGGNDTIDGGSGNDTLNGGDGNDTSRAIPGTTRSMPEPATTPSSSSSAWAEPRCRAGRAPTR